MQSLPMRWNELMVRLALPACTDLGLALVKRYAQPHRRFHVAAHLQMVLDELQAAAAEPELELAAWFHDAIYRPGWSGNERASAALARRELARIGATKTLIEAVADAVLETASHLPSQPSFAPLIDADLAILGSDARAYSAYAHAIRGEFKAIPEPLFRRGRMAFLQAMLARDFIYHTVIGRQRHEAAARRNLSAELASLLHNRGVSSCN